MIAERPPLNSSFTSTGAKFWHHQEALYGLQAGHARPVVTHLMPTDICQHSCAFCSVKTRDGGVLSMADMLAYLNILKPLGLKAVIISGGGNPLLYRCPQNHQWGISELIRAIDAMGLEIGMITNGQPLKDYGGRKSYRNLTPEALDCLTWLRVSMSGFDHSENEVYVPDADPAKTALGFSYVFHDIFPLPPKIAEQLDHAHQKVSTRAELVQLGAGGYYAGARFASDRFDELADSIEKIVAVHHPRYVRLLPNCHSPELIDSRVRELQWMADAINGDRAPVVFVQYKPPSAPKSCYLGYLHPVLNSDGYVYPCDSCVLNEAAGMKFAEPWRVCHWPDIGKLYEEPVHSLIDPQKWCQGCVFTHSNELLTEIVEGAAIPLPTPDVEHVNFI